MIKPNKGLIPRYNWDYHFSDFFKAIQASFQPLNENLSLLEEFFNQKCILTTSGRSSLYAILKALDFPPGAHIGVPLFCCPVVFDAIEKAGCVPVFVDIHTEDYNLSAKDLERKRASLSAVIAVHMFGHPVEMESIYEAAGGIPVIEDCAQSLFSKYKGRLTGTLSKASFFSFRSGKYISAGEGSAIFCNDLELRAKIAAVVEGFSEWSMGKMIPHCMATYIKSTLYQRPWYGLIGLPLGTYLDTKLNLTAKSGFSYDKIAKSDLKIIAGKIHTFEKNIHVQKRYAKYFLKNIQSKNLMLPHERNGSESNYYQFAIRFETTKQRDAMADFLLRRGIDTAKYLDEVVACARDNHTYAGDCPNAELCSKTVLVIPNHYTLPMRDIAAIAKHVNDGAEFLSSRRI